MTTVWIYVDTNYYVGHPDHLKVFATPDAAEEWFKENDPEGVAFGYEGDETRPGILMAQRKPRPDHFGNCPVCGALIDTRDLWQILAHVHGAEIEIGEGHKSPEKPLH